jgi:hypothetical protein
VKAGESLAFSLIRIVVAVGLALGSRHARAQSAESPGAKPKAAVTASEAVPPSPVRGFDMLATAGWGVSTGKTVGLELAPYGASFGIDLGYTWSTGFRLSGYAGKSLGSSTYQQRQPLIGRDYEFTADTSSLNGGLSLGWDTPLYFFVLRYALGFGVSAMRWEFQDVTTKSANFGDGSSPTYGVHVAPGVALLWPYRWFEAGAGFEYFAQVNDMIPSGFVGKLLIGVRP